MIPVSIIQQVEIIGKDGASVARTFCDTYVLHKASFLHVMETHPEFRENIERVVATRKAS